MKHNYFIILAIAAFAAILCLPAPGLASSLLGSAQSFAVLGASAVTSTGPTTINGDLGISPNLVGSITIVPPFTQTGSIYGGPLSLAGQAQIDALVAYTGLAGLPFTTHYLVPTDLGGLTLTPGVYKFDSSAGLTGTLTLDFTGNPNADFVFQIGSTLITASNSSVIVNNGNSTSGVYWQVGSSATLGTNTMFAGNILAHDSVGLDPYAEILGGRAIALNAAVTMSGTNGISNNNPVHDFGSYGFSGGTPVPVPGTLLLLGSGLLGVVLRKTKIV